MRSQVVLEVTAGPLKGQVYTFEEHDTFIFGRAPDAHSRMSERDTTTSRHHFLLEVNPPHARIRDLGSRNGTYVNGKRYGGRERHETPQAAAQRRYPEVEIRDGDTVTVGATVFAVRITGPQADSTELVVAETSFAPGGSSTFPVEALQPAESAESMVAIAGYEMGRKLGEGGMGVVYLVRRRHDGASAALKIMLAKVAVNEQSRQRFLREIDVTRQVRHPNVVELYEFGASGRSFYFVMELCSGGNIDELVRRRGGKVPLKEAGSLIMQVLDGLAAAHARNMVHRDIKPQNILLTAEDGGAAKLSDFGLAKSFDRAGFSGLTVTGTAAGTPRFMSRDQLVSFKYANRASDVWSVAATFYFMLTGHFPRDFPPGRDAIAVILHDEVVPIRRREPALDAKVASVIDRALSDDVVFRHPDASAFRAALGEVL